MGLINPELERGIKKYMKQAYEGNAVMIRNPLPRVDEYYNIMQSRFTLIGSVSGVGKTSFMDNTHVLRNHFAAKNLAGSRFETIYLSMERKAMFKHAKFFAWLLYTQFGYRISSDYLMGHGPVGYSDIQTKYGITKEQLFQAMDAVEPLLIDILDATHIYDGRTSVDKVINLVHTKAAELGTLFTADDHGVFIGPSQTAGYVKEFDDKVFHQTKMGNVPYVEIEHNGQTFQIEKNKHHYQFNNEKTFLQVCVDGVGLIEGRPGQSTKQAVDEITNVLADARDVYGFSPVMVSQFNRGISNIDRQKAHGADLSPQEADFKDSGNTFQAADLVIGLFDPVRFKASDAQGFYCGYDTTRMTTAWGANRLRTMHIIKNSYGPDYINIGLKFLGECSFFDVLPKSNDEAAVEEFYAEIASGRF